MRLKATEVDWPINPGEFVFKRDAVTDEIVGVVAVSPFGRRASIMFQKYPHKPDPVAITGIPGSAQFRFPVNFGDWVGEYRNGTWQD